MPPAIRAAATRIRLALERRALLIRARRALGALAPVADRTAAMPPGPVCITVVRNESARLGPFLDHHRALGVVHFLAVDNGSTDGTAARLAAEPDVSLWRTGASYRAARFGADWVNGLLARHARGRWVLWADADELLVYPRCDRRSLSQLCRWMETRGQTGLGCLMVDLYAPGPLGGAQIPPGTDPRAVLTLFDAAGYRVERNRRLGNLWIRGGPRARVFFADRPEEAPALNKIPLLRWDRGTVFRSGAHDLLPRRRNRVWDRRLSRISGALLHAKLAADLPPRAAEETARAEHFRGGAEWAAYAAAGPGVRPGGAGSVRQAGWRSLVRAGLICDGGWL